MFNLNRYQAGIACLFVLFASCGADFSDWQSSGAETGAVKAIIIGSQSFNPNISHGKIVQYKVTISGSDFSEPIVKTFDGAEESGIIEGVPIGDNRALKVEAINQNNIKIREGEAEGLEITAGEAAETEVKMESVPVFANLNDGNIIPNTQFKVRIFSDPAEQIEVEDEFNGMILPLADADLNSAEIFPDISSGFADIKPALLPPGGHNFTVKNVNTGRTAAVAIRLTDGTKLISAPLYSGSSIKVGRIGKTLLRK
ncbi:MAG: hypothetical protein HYY43_01780 [Deltaproteobacteria bacterium]|nr:hypothetical protein [Deltaproteobacteria bacterium]MBI2341671.1 hypothetical protein [Deltaproteobacteria bacterium]MBI2974307.1 hypothetical protein [Deltaproteobacteria bacterium]